MSNVLQLPGNTVSNVATANSSFDPTANGAVVNADAVVTYTFANTTMHAETVMYSHSNTGPSVTEFIYGSPNEYRQPQVYFYTQTWLNQFFHYPIQGTLQGRANFMNGTVIILERKVPGAGSDPGSGKIPQLEVPTKAAITGTGADDSNPAGMLIPFPPQMIIG